MAKRYILLEVDDPTHIQLIDNGNYEKDQCGLTILSQDNYFDLLKESIRHKSAMSKLKKAGFVRGKAI